MKEAPRALPVAEADGDVRRTATADRWLRADPFVRPGLKAATSAPAPTGHDADPQTVFVRDQFDSAYPAGIEHYWWHLARNAVIERMLAGCVPGPILDVGCGRGIVVDHLRRRGFDCAGVDPGRPEPLPSVGADLTLGVRAEDLPPHDRARVETILLLDVLEHLPRPVEFLRMLEASFPALRHLVVTVPARQEIWSNYDVHYGHHRRYSELGLRAEVESAVSLRCAASGYFFRSLYLPALALRLCGVDRRTQIAAPAPGARGLHRWVAAAVTFADRFPSWGAVGTSVIARFVRGR